MVNIFVVRNDELYLSHEPRHRVYAEQSNVVKLEDYAALRTLMQELAEALKSITEVIRVLYNMDTIYPTSHEDQLALESKLGLKYREARQALAKVKEC